MTGTPRAWGLDVDGASGLGSFAYRSYAERRDWFRHMFKTLDYSTEGQGRRGVAFLCGVLAQILLIGAAVFLGLVFPDELPVGIQRSATVWLAALKPPEKPVVAPPPRPLVRVFVPKVKVPRLVAPVEIPAPPLLRPQSPKIKPPISSATVHVPLPPSPVAQPALPPVKHVEVHTGLFGGGAPVRVTTRRPAEQVQTGGFGSPQALPGHAQGTAPATARTGMRSGCRKAPAWATERAERTACKEWWPAPASAAP